MNNQDTFTIRHIYKDMELVVELDHSKQQISLSSPKLTKDYINNVYGSLENMLKTNNAFRDLGNDIISEIVDLGEDLALSYIESEARKISINGVLNGTLTGTILTESIEQLFDGINYKDIIEGHYNNKYILLLSHYHKTVEFYGIHREETFIIKFAYYVMLLIKDILEQTTNSKTYKTVIVKRESANKITVNFSDGRQIYTFLYPVDDNIKVDIYRQGIPNIYNSAMQILEDY